MKQLSSQAAYIPSSLRALECMAITEGDSDK